ncbi:hypothetical protein B566_EDAN006047 [Ephemera danica]|nr:hypothetical protein B566_EDAN006047 [Ephemera danica]
MKSPQSTSNYNETEIQTVFSGSSSLDNPKTVLHCQLKPEIPPIFFLRLDLLVHFLVRITHFQVCPNPTCMFLDHRLQSLTITLQLTGVQYLAIATHREVMGLHSSRVDNKIQRSQVLADS